MVHAVFVQDGEDGMGKVGKCGVGYNHGFSDGHLLTGPTGPETEKIPYRGRYGIFQGLMITVLLLGSIRIPTPPKPWTARRLYHLYVCFVQSTEYAGRKG